LKSKSQITKKQTQKEYKNKPETLENQNEIYDLEERTALFAERARTFCLKLPRNPVNAEYIPQLIRAASSPGANYIEANESIGDKDFKMKIKTCRRKSKESAYWLRLVITDGSTEQEHERAYLRQEAKGIYTHIYSNSEEERIIIKKSQITKSKSQKRKQKENKKLLLEIKY